MLMTRKSLCSFFISGVLSLSVLFAYMDANHTAGFNFGAAGDYGCNSNTQKTLNNIKSHTTVEMHLALGDYSYQSTGTCWLNMIDSSNLATRTKITIGNHEDDSGESFSQYMNFFKLSKTYYAFTYGNARVIVMDSDHDSFSSGSSQYSFVVSELQKAAQDPNIIWKIVYLHKQMYTSPNTCGSSSCSNTASDTTSLRNTYHPKFDQYGVDLVLNGHLHNYQRSFPIKYDSGSPSSPTITSSNGYEWNDPTGEIFATVGTGGVNFHGLSGKSSFVKYQQDDRFGSLDISIENNGYTLAGRYYTNDGVKRDTFKITKTGIAQYTFGPSLALSGEETTSSTAPGGDTLSKNGLDNGKNTFQPNGQGKGLNCEHFTQQGPLRCR
jgi:hypothetical protein